METAGIAGIIAGLAALVLLFKPFFDDFDGFADCIRYWLTPDMWSWISGEGMEDWWSEMKLGTWLICGGATGYGVYALFTGS